MRRLVVTIALLTLSACNEIQEELANTVQLKEEIITNTENWEQAKASSQQTITEIWDATKQSGDHAWQESKASSADLWELGKNSSKQLWAELELESQAAWSNTKDELNLLLEEKDLTNDVSEI